MCGKFLGANVLKFPAQEPRLFSFFSFSKVWSVRYSRSFIFLLANASKIASTRFMSTCLRSPGTPFQNNTTLWKEIKFGCNIYIPQSAPVLLSMTLKACHNKCAILVWCISAPFSPSLSYTMKVGT